MKLGIDIDDVVAEYVTGLTDYYNHAHFDNVKPVSIREWDLKKSFKKASSPEQMKALMDSFMYHDHFEKLPSVTGAVNTIHKLMGEGHTPYFITSRSSKAIDTTYKWLDRHGLPIERVYFNKDKGWLCERLGLDAHVDDGLHNLDDIASRDFHKTYTYLFERPWNKVTPSRYSHERVKDWKELYAAIHQLQERKKP